MCTLSTPGTRRSRGGGTRPPEPVARGDGKAHAMRARHARTTTTRTVVLSLLDVEARGVRVPRGGVARSSSPERAKYPESVPSAGRRIAKTSVVRSRRASVTRPRAVRVAARSEEGDSAPSEPTSDSGEKNCSRISFDSSQSFPPRSRGFRTGIRRGHTEGARDAEAPSGTRSSPRSCTAVVRPGTVPRPRSARAAARPGEASRTMEQIHVPHPDGAGPARPRARARLPPAETTASSPARRV